MREIDLFAVSVIFKDEKEAKSFARFLKKEKELSEFKNIGKIALQNITVEKEYIESL